MAVNAYVNFKGNCREAVEFYAAAFGVDVPELMTYGEVPPESGIDVSDTQKNLIKHASLHVWGGTIMFADVSSPASFVEGNNISLMIITNNMSEVKPIFDKLKVGGTVIEELQETFWSKCYGIVKDKFGVEWRIMYAEK
ncbi:VOC family protein [Dethiobacter alkaliphilus]|uniref:VOC family protein n=1 Tax=Dethiobacter alkaliphilus TaxID=427926 RepID=UPI0022263F3D|nr:VOC family protein [Dethiobacter alkaliphilus]MCW3491606.1 VOC family protein [Dethiobacter alkaliphilus]